MAVVSAHTVGGYTDFLRVVFASASAAMLLPFQHRKQKAK